jgi:hypothetical protein
MAFPAEKNCSKRKPAKFLAKTGDGISNFGK